MNFEGILTARKFRVFVLGLKVSAGSAAANRPALARASFLLTMVTIDMPRRVADIVRAPETARCAPEAASKSGRQVSTLLRTLKAGGNKNKNKNVI